MLSEAVHIIPSRTITWADSSRRESTRRDKHVQIVSRIYRFVLTDQQNLENIHLHVIFISNGTNARHERSS